MLFKFQLKPQNLETKPHILKILYIYVYMYIGITICIPNLEFDQN